MSDLPEHLRAVVAEIETEIGDLGELPLGTPAAPGTPVAEPGARQARSGLPIPAPVRDIEGGGGHGDGILAANRRVEDAVRQILVEIGEDPDRAGLAGTPERVHRMYAELTAGYHVDPQRLMNGALFQADYREMVVVKNIPFYSLCEHHLLPFFGEAAVAYIPKGRLIGLSKIPRIVEMFARRLQVQERMTQQIADFLMEHLQPMGVGVVLEATHLCSVMRGVRKEGTVMTTSHVLGLFRTRDRTRAEFLAHLERNERSR